MRPWWSRRSTGTRSCSCSAVRAISISAGRCRCQLNRRLGFAVSNVAAGAWRDLIRDRLFPLRPFARFFIVCVPPEPTQIRDLADRGVDALAFEAPVPRAVFEDPQHERISGFARDASRHKLATCALGVEDRGTALALLAAGVDFLGGARGRAEGR